MPSNMIPIYYSDSKSALGHIYIKLEFDMHALWD